MNSGIIKSAPVSSDNFREEKGRKLVRAISAESIYRMLLFIDHILYPKDHFVHDVLCASRAVLAFTLIKLIQGAFPKNVKKANL